MTPDAGARDAFKVACCLLALSKAVVQGRPPSRGRTDLGGKRAGRQAEGGVGLRARRAGAVYQPARNAGDTRHRSSGAQCALAGVTPPRSTSRWPRGTRRPRPRVRTWPLPRAAPPRASFAAEPGSPQRDSRDTTRSTGRLSQDAPGSPTNPSFPRTFGKSSRFRLPRGDFLTWARSGADCSKKRKRGDRMVKASVQYPPTG